MEVIRNVEQFQRLRQTWQEKTVGFVPTMGALHAGHRSLLERSRSENDISILSIYVNPTQFNDAKDLANYPVTFEEDQLIAQGAQVDYLLCPTYQELYPDQYHYRVCETDLSQNLCGAHRPGHFDGVLTVVLKLLNLVRPHRAYFGEKDFQQLLLVKGMVKAFFLDVEIIACSTVRERDGLALSSRNRNLTAGERERAPEFFRILAQRQKGCESLKQELESAGFGVDYVKEVQGRRFGAVKLGQVRLIDNVEL